MCVRKKREVDREKRRMKAKKKAAKKKVAKKKSAKNKKGKGLGIYGLAKRPGAGLDKKGSDRNRWEEASKSDLSA